MLIRRAGSPRRGPGSFNPDKHGEEVSRCGDPGTQPEPLLLHPRRRPPPSGNPAPHVASPSPPRGCGSGSAARSPRGEQAAGPRRRAAGGGTRWAEGARPPLSYLRWAPGRRRRRAAAAFALPRDRPLAATHARAPSAPAAAAAPGPRGPASAPEVVAGGAEHAGTLAGTLAGPRGSSRRRGILPSRTRAFRSGRRARSVTPAAANEQGEFALPRPSAGRGNQSRPRRGRTRQVAKEERGEGGKCGWQPRNRTLPRAGIPKATAASVVGPRHEGRTRPEGRTGNCL